MLTVADAQSLILRQVRPLPPASLPLSAALLGHVLAEDVAADADSPPYAKAMMDGYAIRAADLASGQATLHLVEEITAGHTPRHAVAAGEASRIMTGAPIPAGADAVVMVERSRLLDDGRVLLEDRPPRPGQNVLPQGREMRRGETVLAAGSVLRPQEVGVLATVGRTSVVVFPAPSVAILSTGDEVVDPPAVPGPGQIRNSNGPMLTAQVARAGGVPRYLGIAPDRLDGLRPLVEDGLRSDVLLLSGGVSAGKLDLVPDVLRQGGVEARLHKVALKPGKPVYFGTRSRPDRDAPTLVFGLPGNPVSSFVCFELFVRPALRRLRGHADAGPDVVNAVLAEDFAYSTDRPTYHPARLELTADGWRVRPVPWFGSPDLRGLTRADALLVVPVGEGPYRAGRPFDVVRLDGGMLP
jgi:molybdopterin molybdotransferase